MQRMRFGNGGLYISQNGTDLHHRLAHKTKIEPEMFSLANNLLVSARSVKYFCIDTLVLQITFVL